MAAFRAAEADGADGIELDVRLESGLACRWSFTTRRWSGPVTGNQRGPVGSYRRAHCGSSMPVERDGRGRLPASGCRPWREVSPGPGSRLRINVEIKDAAAGSRSPRLWWHRSTPRCPGAGIVLRSSSAGSDPLSSGFAASLRSGFLRRTPTSWHLVPLGGRCLPAPRAPPRALIPHQPGAGPRLSPAGGWRVYPWTVDAATLLGLLGLRGLGVGRGLYQ